MKILLLILALTVMGQNTSTKIYSLLDQYADQPLEDQYAAWQFVHKKAYSLDSRESINRFEIFKSNVKTIKEVNSQQKSYQLGLTEFADLTFEEFSEKYLMKNFPSVERNMQETFMQDFGTTDNNSKLLFKSY
jgi:xylem cysteine proteinase